MTGEQRLSPRAWVLLTLASLAMFLPGFATLPPVDRDEGRYIVSSQRMAETGDFIDIRYQDEPRYLQPAGIYWLQSLSTLALDSPGHDSVWSYRVPSLMAALGAVLLTALFAARFFGAPVGFAAGLLLAACLSLNFEARIAKTDAALLASIATAQFALMRMYLVPNAKRWLAALFWAALGIGLLIKGPIILIVVGATVAALVVWDSLSLRKEGEGWGEGGPQTERGTPSAKSDPPALPPHPALSPNLGERVSWLAQLRPFWGPLLMLAIALPWYVAIGFVSDGGFYERAIGQSMMDKVGNSQQGHSGPPGYHLALLLLMFWPGSLLVARAATIAWRRRGEAAVRFLVCWIVPTWVVFEFVATKLPHYVLPTYPALACLCALALYDPAPSKGMARRVALVLWSLLWAAATIAIAALGPAAFRESEGYIPWPAMALAAATALAGAAALWFMWRKQTSRTLMALGAAGLLGWITIFGVNAPGLTQLWMSPRIDDMVRAARPCENSVLITVPYTEPSLVFLYGREHVLLAKSGADAAGALAAAPECDVALIGAAEREEFLKRAADLGLAPANIGEIGGRNYSNGDTLSLTLYRDAGHGQQ